MTTMSSPLSWHTGDGTGGPYGAVSPRHSFVAEGLPDFRLDAKDVSRGAVEVVAISPTGVTSPMKVIDTDGVFSTNFMPTEIGDWRIMILYDGQHVDGSPFTVKVYDPGQVRVSGLSSGVVGAAVHFAIDASGAGEGHLDVAVSHDARNVPTQVNTGQAGRHHVSFVPNSPGHYQIRVYFAGVEISESPLTVDIADHRSVTVSGSGLRQAEANQLTTFTIHAGQQSVYNANNFKVILRSPNGLTTSATVTDNGNGTYNVEYTPSDIGEHLVDVLYHDAPVIGSPFRCQVFDSSKVRVRNLPPFVNIDTNVEFEIDASEAGAGNIEIVINDGRVPCHVTLCTASLFRASFVPKETTVHYVAMTFNGCKVPGSPWRVSVQSAGKVGVAGNGIRQVLVGRAANVDVSGCKSPVTVSVLSPSGVSLIVKSSKQKNAQQRFEYIPLEVGSHTVSVSCDGAHLTGSPFVAKSFSTSAIQLSGMPSVGVIRCPVEFTVDVNNAGEGELAIMVNKGTIPNSVRMVSAGLYQVSFVPKESKPHTVDIKFNSAPLPGGSVVVPVIDLSRVTVKGEGLNRAAVNTPATFRVNTKNSGEADLAVTVTAVDDPAQYTPVTVRGSSSRGYDVEYTTRTPGTYKLDVTMGGIGILGSPFHVKSFDINLVRVFGLSDGVVSRITTFSVNVAEAGEGSMEISITPLNGKNLPNEVRPVGNGMFEVSFMPTHPGNHRASVLFNNEHVQGSPFKFNVTDVTRVTAKGAGLSSAACRQPASFAVSTATVAAAGGPALNHTDLDVLVIGPDGRYVRNEVHASGRHGFLVEYTPQVAGKYRVEVNCHGVAIAGSPFAVSVWDASQVKVYNVPPVGHLNTPATFNIDARRAGVGNLEITINSNSDAPSNFVDADDTDAHYRVTFTPLTLETYSIVVKFNGDPVTGSPFYHSVVDGRLARAEGPGLAAVIAHRATSFDVFTSEVGGDASLDVTVHAPSGRRVPVQVSGSSNSSYTVAYTPTESGQHVVTVKYADDDIKGSPFYPEVLDPHQVWVSSIPQIAVRDQPVNFDVQTSGAGDGRKLSVVVKGRTSQPSVQLVRRQTAGDFDVTFTPSETGQHCIDVLFSDIPVTGSPFRCEVVDPSHIAVIWESISLCPANQTAQLDLDLKTMSPSDLDVKVTDPYGKTVSTRVNHVGSRHRVEFEPTDIGPHTVDIKYAGQPIEGSPYIANVYDVSRVRLNDAPSTGVVGKDVHFIVDTSEAGTGDVDVTVTCSSGHVVVKRQQLDEFRQKFVFAPSLAVKHDVIIAFNKQQIPGSPLSVSVVDGSDVMWISAPTDPAPVDSVNYLTVNTNERSERVDLSQCLVKVTAPNRSVVPAKILKQSGGEYQLEYSSKFTGRHDAKVMYNKRHVTGSPFQLEMFDPTKVKLESAQTSGVVGDEMSLNIIRDEAGKADLGLKISGPQARSSVPFNITATDRGDHVTYVAKETGTYVIDVTYGRLTVPGSPVKHTVQSGAAVVAFGSGLVSACEGQPARFVVDSRGERGELLVHVDGPNSVAGCTVEPQPDGVYQVHYVPLEVGEYSVSVRWNGRELRGSPFHPTVVNPSRVQLVGGWESVLDARSNSLRLALRQPFSLEFNTRAAGPGRMTAEVRCSDGYIPVDVVPRGSDHYVVTFLPQVPGEYEINVLWNEMKVARCPVTGRAEVITPPVTPKALCKVTPPPPPNRDKIILTGLGLTTARINRQAEFVIDATDAAPGVPDAKLTGLHSEVPVCCSPIGIQKYRCTYTPTVPGLHLLYILWRNRLVRGCPYEVNVDDCGSASRVTCSGAGLSEGVVTQQFSVQIDARRAAPGELVASCEGPTQSATCLVSDNKDGTFTLNVVTAEAGRHVLSIQHEGQHTAGSPFILLVTAEPNADKVRIHGPGIEHGVLSTFQGNFVVDTAGAGSGQLVVKVRGPKGAFRVEMQRDSRQPRSILCHYDVTEPGTYVIHVLWSNIEIPGSPFVIRICATRSELERVRSDRNDQSQFGHRAVSPQSSWLNN